MPFRKMQKKYNTPGHYRIQFATCLCKVVARSKRKKLKKNYGHKQDYKAMEPPKKKMVGEKLVRDLKNKQEIQNYDVK